MHGYSVLRFDSLTLCCEMRFAQTFCNACRNDISACLAHHYDPLEISVKRDFYGHYNVTLFPLLNLQPCDHSFGSLANQALPSQ